MVWHFLFASIGFFVVLAIGLSGSILVVLAIIAQIDRWRQKRKRVLQKQKEAISPLVRSQINEILERDREEGQLL